MSTFDHFGVDVKTNGDHFGVDLGIISGLGIILGSGSFWGRDHFGGCTVLHIRDLRSADSLRYRNRADISFLMCE